jgi:hypothetical protein
VSRSGTASEPGSPEGSAGRVRRLLGGRHRQSLARPDAPAAIDSIAGLPGPKAVEIDLGVRWDVGAPLPHLVSNGSTAVLIAHSREPDPDWDGTYVKVVSPSDPEPDWFVVLTFVGCASVRFGSPNDEALHGHPLADHGLSAYRAHKVVNSPWLEEHIRVNSVHPHHSEARWRELTHFFLVFHDETFEALARTVRAEHRAGTLPGLLAEATRRFTAT